MPLPELLSLQEAAKLVKSGDTLASGGLMMYRRPMAFVKALLKERPTDLTLLCFTAGLESDLLVGAGMVKQVRTCYFGLETFGLAPMFTEAANRGEIVICEETEASLALGFRAAMSGIGFMPGFAWLGTDLLRLRPDVKTIQDPYSGETLVAFPAISCDVAAIHAVKVDRYGNAILNKNLGVDVELTLIAKRVIITAEEIVEKLTEDVDVPGVRVNAIVHAPNGAAPTSCYPLYSIQGMEILRYIEYCNRNDFEGYLDTILTQRVI